MVAEWIELRPLIEACLVIVMIDVEDLIQTFRQRWQARDVESNGFALVFGKKMLSEVGFEPTLSYEDQNSLCSPLSRGQGIYLESGALDHSAILTELVHLAKFHHYNVKKLISAQPQKKY